MGVGDRSSRPEGGRRVVWVDLLRLVMTFQMVQGHSLDAILASSERSGAVFDAWTWARGLTSVGFLFAAGVSFHLATVVRFERHRSNPLAVRRRLRRGVQLVVIGYLLHFPVGALSGDVEAVRQALADFAIIDVLQCIGVSILLLEGVTLLARRAWHVTAAASVLAVLAIGLAPIAGLLPSGGAGAVLVNWLTPSGGSIFPLLPWSGYLFAGVACAALALPRGPATESRRSAVVLVTLGAVLVTVAWLAGAQPSPYPVGAAEPSVGLLKLGVVVLLTGGLAVLQTRVSHLPEPMRVLAGETLAVYVFHIMLLYGAGYGLADLVGERIPLGGAIAVAGLVMVLSLAVGLGWSRIKQRSIPRGPLLARTTGTE